MDVPIYYWLGGSVFLVCIILVLVRKHLMFIRKIKGFEKRQKFWLQHRNTLAGNFVMTYKDPIEDTYILDKESELLGRGGYGIVVLGIHKHSKVKYAIKFMNKDFLEKKNSKINRLEREYKLLKDIDHANIVRLYAVYDSAHEVGFVMELCSGGHLGHWLENMKYEPCRVPSETDIKSITRQLLSAVAHMHTRGICHRDIKLQNILRESNHQHAQIKLVDFGLGTRFVGALPLKTHCGTLYSTAPEVIRESYDERCDIWSCGVVAFTLLCGRKPFEALVMHPGNGDNASGKSSVTANILMGRFHFKNREWHRRSRKSIEFVKLMMTPDYRARWYAQEALEHSWLHGDNDDDGIERIFTGDEEDERNRTSRTFSSDSAELQSFTSSVQKGLQPLLTNMKKQADSSVLHQASRLAMAYGMPQSQATDRRRQIFQAFDVDNNGSLSRQEFRKAFKEFGKLALPNSNSDKKMIDSASECSVADTEDTEDLMHLNEILNLSEMDIDAVFNAIDVNGDNEISFTEFLAATLDPRDFDTMAINTAFDMLDTDKKGYITAGDMERVLAVTATARGRRRNSNTSTSGSGKYSRSSSLASETKPTPQPTASPIRRHHSFTLGAKRGSRRGSLGIFSQKLHSKLSPVNSAAGENSDSKSAAPPRFLPSNDFDSNASDDGIEEKVSEKIDKSKKYQLGKENFDRKLSTQVVDNRPGVQRQRSLSTMSFGDFLRRPSVLVTHHQVANLYKPPNSSTFSFLNGLRNKSTTVTPSFVEEGEYSNSEVANNVRNNNSVSGGDVSNEDILADDFSLRALSTPNMFAQSTNKSLKSTFRRENSKEANFLNEIDDRTYEQIKGAIKLCDRNNTGVVSYTDFLLAMTGNNYDGSNNSGSGSCNTSRRNSTTPSATEYVPGYSYGDENI